MTGTEYQDLAMRTNDGLSFYRLNKAMAEGNHMDIGTAGLMEGLLGLSGETGELLDLFKKWIFQEHPLDIEHAKKELGDVFWYAAMICRSMGWNMDEIMQMNVEKLAERYPGKFDTSKSILRRPDDV